MAQLFSLGVMSTTRKLIPVFFFGALAIAAGIWGICDIVVCLRDIFARSLAAWNDFLGAEFLLLFAWRFLGITALSLAIYRGRVRNEQVRLKSGTIGRVLFLVATGAACFGYITAKFLFHMPWWFTHLGHAVVAVLMFCVFTYPWRRRIRMTPNTALEPTPTAP